MGKQAIDDDSNQVGQMLAALPNSGPRVRSRRVHSLKVTVLGHARSRRRTSTVSLKLPAVVTTDLVNQPRYASLPNMKAQEPIAESRGRLRG
jgi:electron transfer flavoprotein beta subunit